MTDQGRNKNKDAMDMGGNVGCLCIYTSRKARRTATNERDSTFVETTITSPNRGTYGQQITSSK